MDYLEPFHLAELDVGIRERRPTKAEYITSGRILNCSALNDQETIEGPGLFLVGEKR